MEKLNVVNPLTQFQSTDLSTSSTFGNTNFTAHNVSSIYLCCSLSAQFGRGAKKDIRSATATTTEMVGKLNLRVLHGGAATLHSIKVMQPKQVSVKTLIGLPFYVCALIQNLTNYNPFNFLPVQTQFFLLWEIYCM